MSETDFLIDSVSRRLVSPNSNGKSVQFYDDPSFFIEPNVIQTNFKPYNPNVIVRSSGNPKLTSNYGSQFVSNSNSNNNNMLNVNDDSDIVYAIQKQFANDKKDRSKAKASIWRSVIIVIPACILCYLGLVNFLITWFHAVQNFNGCLGPNNNLFTSINSVPGLIWFLVTAGIWVVVLPFPLALILDCSPTNSSTADYTHTFDPQLRIRGTKKGQFNNKTKTIIILCLVVCVLAFIASVVDTVMSYYCSLDTIYKHLPKFIIPLLIAIVTIILFIVIIIIYGKEKSKDEDDDLDYDRRVYDVPVNKTFYYDASPPQPQPPQTTTTVVSDVTTPPKKPNKKKPNVVLVPVPVPVSGYSGQPVPGPVEIPVFNPISPVYNRSIFNPVDVRQPPQQPQQPQQQPQSIFSPNMMNFPMEQARTYGDQVYQLQSPMRFRLP